MDAHSERCGTDAQGVERTGMRMEAEHNPFSRDIAKKIVLPDDFRRIAVLVEPLPPIGVVGNTRCPKAELLGAQIKASQKGCETIDPFIHRVFFFGEPHLGCMEKFIQIIGPARFKPVAKAAELRAAERLAADDSTRCGAVDIEIPRFDFCCPKILFPFVYTLESRSQAIWDCIGQFNGMGQIACAHEAEHRAKELCHMGKTMRAHMELDSRCPKAGIVRVFARFK